MKSVSTPIEANPGRVVAVVIAKLLTEAAEEASR